MWLIGVSAAAGCAHGPERSAEPLRGPAPAELRDLVDRGLAVSGERVQFEDERSIPPRLKGVPTDSTVKLQIVPGQRPPVAQTRQSMRARAVGDPRASAALGKRFALLSSGWLEVEKGREVAADDRYRMIFYNYDANQVVTVIVSTGGDVMDVLASAPTVQPPESREEVEVAAAIVRSDERYAALTRGLTVRGIQTEGRGDHRTLYLTFYEPNRRQAVYEATVDMTAGKVLKARAIR
jgi:hypothetical protein